MRPGTAAVLLAVLLPAEPIRGEGIHDPPEDAALIEAERFEGLDAEGSASAASFNRWAAAAFFPAGRIGHRQAFGGLRAEATDREYGAGSGAGPWVQRYALTAGSEIVKGPRQESFAMVIGGLQGDFRRLDRDAAAMEWIYAHLFTARSGLEWGAGLDLMYYLDSWYPFPLLFLEAWLREGLKARVNGDVAEIRWFPVPRACLTAGARYSISYGSLGREAAFLLEGVGLEAGGEFRLARDLSFRLKMKRFVWGTDEAGPSLPRAGGALEGGGSLRLTVAYSP